ncbi:MAG: hypothetical protein EXX96DRAFT_563017 [Benjaminiella poitrasii]|nr:MAG: hypothetical protein EXX96DRAFT_563017 [Benjaminiella poitrasii]
MMNSTVNNTAVATLPLYHPYPTFRYNSHHHNHHHHHHPHHHHQQASSSIEEESPTLDDEDQIPSMIDFKAIIDDYLNNLSPKKRDKALVDAHRYCLIQQVLRDPRNTAISTAQFRFWVKKMFQLQPGTTDVVCHDNKPVAMKEQIYDILVKAHREAHHGGRDKTSALVRRRYSWIPKELVARFVRHCPFCITRRNSGHSPSVLISKTTHPSPRYYRHSFDASDDLSSGPPSSSDSSYDTMPQPPSPGRTNANAIYFHTMYSDDNHHQQQQQSQSDFLVVADPYDCFQTAQPPSRPYYHRTSSPSAAAAAATANMFYHSQPYQHPTAAANTTAATPFYYPSAMMRSTIDLIDPTHVLSTSQEQQQQSLFPHFTATAPTSEDVVSFHDI